MRRVAYGQAIMKRFKISKYGKRKIDTDPTVVVAGERTGEDDSGKRGCIFPVGRVFRRVYRYASNYSSSSVSTSSTSTTAFPHISRKASRSASASQVWVFGIGVNCAYRTCIKAFSAMCADVVVYLRFLTEHFYCSFDGAF